MTVEHDLAGKPWFRLYSEFVSDPKVQLLAFEDQRHFVALLCLKCNGTLDTSSVSQDHHERLIAKAIGLDPISAIEVKRRLMEVGLIEQDWTPSKWDSRQYESDSSAARMHKWREKKKAVTSHDRHGDVTVTAKNRADTEQNKEEALRATPGLNWDAWEAFYDYRKSVGKPIKPASMAEAAKKLATFGKDQCAVVTQSIANGWQGLFALKDAPRFQAVTNGVRSQIPEDRDREQLLERAARIGFRKPSDNESLPAYQTLLQRAELAAREAAKGPLRSGAAQ